MFCFSSIATLSVPSVCKPDLAGFTTFTLPPLIYSSIARPYIPHEKTTKPKMPRAPQHRPDAPNGGGKWTRKNELFLWHARKSNSTHWTHEKIGKELGKSALACRLKYHKLNVAARKGKWSPDEQASPSSASARALMPPPAPPQPRPLAPATTPNFRDATGMRPSSQSTGTSSDSDHARQRSSRRHQPSMQRSEMHQEPPRHQQ